ncbi:MAG: hypothetical protein RJA70_4194 [Pseudomonadota bacterium]|jgi:uncharacterized protein YqeY
MLIDELKQRMFAAMKAKNIVEKEIIRTVIGDVTSTGAEADDARVLTVVKKLIKSNEETLKSSSDDAQKATLMEELQILHQFVPAGLSTEQLTAALADVAESIRAAGNDGQATGIAMKHLKASQVEADGKDVSAAVKALRA